MGSVPLVFTSQLPVPGSSLARDCQLRLVLCSASGSLLSRAPLRCLEGPPLKLLFGTEWYLCRKLQFQIVTQLIPASLAVWLSSAPLLLHQCCYSSGSAVRQVSYSQKSIHFCSNNIGPVSARLRIRPVPRLAQAKQQKYMTVTEK